MPCGMDDNTVNCTQCESTFLHSTPVLDTSKARISPRLWPHPLPVALWKPLSFCSQPILSMNAQYASPAIRKPACLSSHRATTLSTSRQDIAPTYYSSHGDPPIARAETQAPPAPSQSTPGESEPLYTFDVAIGATYQIKVSSLSGDSRRSPRVDRR
jgi:hypothetical protein